jgi:hypothetical protein
MTSRLSDDELLVRLRRRTGSDTVPASEIRALDTALRTKIDNVLVTAKEEDHVWRVEYLRLTQAHALRMTWMEAELSNLRAELRSVDRRGVLETLARDLARWLDRVAARLQRKPLDTPVVVIPYQRDVEVDDEVAMQQDEQITLLEELGAAKRFKCQHCLKYVADGPHAECPHCGAVWMSNVESVA